jgi:plasmid maintenance system antidote protein VapI
LETLVSVAVAAVAALLSALGSDVTSAVLREVRRAVARLLGRTLPEQEELAQEREAATDPLAERLARLRTSLSESAALLPTLQAELELRTAALDRLQADAAHYERLAALHREEAEAVQRLVEQTVGRGLRETTRRGGRQQALYFAAGLAASIPLGIIANVLYSWLSR